MTPVSSSTEFEQFFTDAESNPAPEPVEDEPAFDSEAVKTAKLLACDIIGEWPEDQPFHARWFVDEQPVLAASRSVVLDLVYEEYCRKLESNTPVDHATIAAEFPGLERTILALLDTHDKAAAHPDLLPIADRVDWPEAGEPFLHFDLLAELGRGLYSRVFLAEEIPIGRRRVVVKICLQGDHEADVLGRLQHPHIGQIHAVHVDPDSECAAICMPFVTTVTLAEQIDAHFDRCSPDPKSPTDSSPTNSTEKSPQRPLEVESVVRIGSQVAEALAYSHEQGVVHGDVKPSNVLISDDGAKLIDFNLSIRDAAMQRCLGGTLPYMPPEQLAMIHDGFRDPEFQPAGDVYSLGATLFESLTGRLPFGPHKPTPDGGYWTLIDELRTRQRSASPSVRKGAPHVPVALADVVERCLSPEPASRPAAKELATALQEMLPNPEPQQPAARRRATISAVVVAALLAIAGLGYPIFEPANEIERSPAVALEQAAERIDAGDYAEAARLLSAASDAPGASNDAGILAAIGYERARIAGNAERSETKFAEGEAAIRLFQQALKMKHPQERLLLQNIGFCRRIVGRHRKRDDRKVPAEVAELTRDAVYARIVDDASVIGRRQSLDLSVVEFAVQKWPDDRQIQAIAMRCYAHESAIADTDVKRRALEHRSFEHGWLALDKFGRADPGIGTIRHWSKSIELNPEFQEMTRTDRRRIVLQAPSGASVD